MKDRENCKVLQYSYSEKEATFKCRIFNEEIDYQFYIGFFIISSQKKLCFQILRGQGDEQTFETPQIINEIENALIDPNFPRREVNEAFQRPVISAKTLQEMGIVMTVEQFNETFNHVIQCCLQAPYLEMKRYGVKALRQLVSQVSEHCWSFIKGKEVVQDKMAEATVYLLDATHGWEVNEQAVMTLSTLMKSEITGLFNTLIHERYSEDVSLNLQRIANKEVVEVFREQHAVDIAKAILHEF
jgi:hypothetical protein